MNELNQLKQKQINFIKEYLLNKRGLVESQRLTESYFKLRNIDISFIKDIIFDNEVLFDFIFNNIFDYKENQYNQKNNKCLNCGNPTKFVNVNRGYKKYCSTHCAGKYTSNPDKVKQTKLERYGSENYNNIQKNLQTKLERYGDPKYNNWQRCMQTKLEKYGSENYNNMEQHRQTCLERYGVEHSSNTEKVREKIRVGILSDYDNIKPNRENYNLDYITEHFTDQNDFLINDFCEYFDLGWSHANQFRKTYLPDYRNKIKKHKTQTFIFNNIKTENKILNDRNVLNGLELDIYLPDQKLAIEYDGLLYHSQGIKTHSIFPGPDFDKNYHLKKTELCLDNDIQLFHIFEGEDLDLWFSMINNKLGLSKRIFARKCIVKELNNKDVLDFLNENHIQGYYPAKINLGLYYNNELVQVMTFSKPRFNKNYEYELIRLCSTKNTTVVGGPSKLLNYFKKKYEPKSIISYANRRFSNGSIYEKLGFKLISVSNPNYFYFKLKDLKLESRNKYQKHKLSKLLENFDPNLSESENMFNNGYRRIFDCGNLVYELKL